VQTFRTRLPACDRWHPGTPSRIARHSAGRESAAGKPQFRHVCLECQQLRIIGYRQLVKPYGIVPLNWTPPEMIDSLVVTE
jgi:hypothetical protein